MSALTRAEIVAKIEADLDLEEETFITTNELYNYINEAIRDCEAEIHTLYEDYFLVSAPISLVTGTSEYSLPADIYANKIRGLVFDNGSDKYLMTRIKKFEDIPFVQSNDPYQFLITNSGTSGIKLKLFPNSRDTSASFLTVWYLREAKKLAADGDICDIPEFINYILSHIKVSCLKKEGHPLLPIEVANLDKLRQNMVETLSSMVVDGDTKIPLDTSFYEDFDNCFGY